MRREKKQTKRKEKKRKRTERKRKQKKNKAKENKAKRAARFGREGIRRNFGATKDRTKHKSISHTDLKPRFLAMKYSQIMKKYTHNFIRN